MENHEVQKVNYIKHLLAVSQKFNGDTRLSALHISLYYTLFQNWNLSKFRNPISICREEVMQASKIGSANTYTKCLKDLDKWQYLKYLPSFNPQVGSKIYLYTFNKASDNGSNICIDKTIDKSSEKATAKAMIPYTNTLNKLNHTKSLNKTRRTPIQNNNHLKISKNGKEKSGTSRKEKSSGKKERQNSSGKAAKGQVRPLLQDIGNYFSENQWPEIEGQKFFNHYESNGWLIGGKTPMKNWQASARNWMLNAVNFKNERVKPQPGRLAVTENKNYGEPL